MLNYLKFKGEKMTREELIKVIEKIKEKSAMKAYSLTVNPDKVPDIFQSKIGGLPYWDSTKEYPKDENGSLLFLLAQINCDDLPEDDRLPQKGMLQFFIDSGDMDFGLDFKQGDSRKNFRVVYHENINYDVKAEDIPDAYKLLSEDDYLPTNGEYVLDIEEKTVYTNPEEYNFENIFKESAKELGIKMTADNVYDEVSQEGYSYLCDVFNGFGHFLLGYPCFTQCDPRDDCEEYQVYDTMLIQIDSDGGEYVTWGDAGIGNFFINKEDLKNKNFDRILYNWDCC